VQNYKKLLRAAYGLALVGTGGLAAPAFAHHSVAAYDLSKIVRLKGTIREFDWENPHCWVWIDVPNAAGGVDPWGIESSSPGALRRAGLTWDAMKKGDKVTLSVWPMRDGRHGGGLARITYADGHSWQPTGSASPLPPGVAPTSQSDQTDKTYKGPTAGVP